MPERSDDLQTLLHALAENAALACGADDGTIVLVERDTYRVSAHFGPIPVVELDQPLVPRGNARPLDRASITGQVILDGQTYHAADALDPGRPTSLTHWAETTGFRTVLITPLLHGSTALGAITIRRTRVEPFTDEQIARLETFARLAAIAVEHDLLRLELRDALEREKASSEVLKVIAASPTDIQPALEAIVESTMRLCEAQAVTIRMVEGDQLRAVARRGQYARAELVPLSADLVPGRAVIERQTIVIRDASRETGPGTAFPADFGYATAPAAVLAVPLVREGQAIGVLNSRAHDHEFSERQIALVETFAAQAVIAIENVRLFKEINERNAELQEALERETATAEVLGIIARSPSDEQPVLDAIVASAARLFDASDVRLNRSEGDGRRLVAFFGELTRGSPGAGVRVNDPRFISDRAALERHTIHVHDLQSDEGDEFPNSQQTAREFGFHTALATPLLREGEAIGTLSIRRREVKPFSEAEVALVETFAAQAVIAIENVRLFKEINERNEDLRAALERQTATAEVLDIIARSPAEVQPVLDAIANSAIQLFGAKEVRIRRLEGGTVVKAGVRVTADAGRIPTIGHAMLQPTLLSSQAILQRRTIHVHDMQAEEGAAYPDTQHQAMQSGDRTMLSTPLLREGEPVGVLSIRRGEVKPFTEAEIALIETFANQAVIAIENARLFNDLKAALDRQTATSEVLGIIGSSTTDTAPVFDAIARAAARVLQADNASVWVVEEDEQVLAGRAGSPLQNWSVGQRRPLAQQRGLNGQVIRRRQTIHIPDIAELEDQAYDGLKVRMQSSGWISLLGTPLWRGADVVGAISISRTERRPFAPEEIALMETFAAQAVIAMENARLYHEIQEKNQALAEASKHKSEFLANMSHELRTPLNAIISFSEILKEDAQDNDDEQYLDDLEEIRSAGKHLLGLINDVLDLSKIEAGRMELYPEEFALEDVIREVRSLAQPLMEKNGNALVVEAEPDLGAMYSDLTKVKQCLLNLLSNAAKFTEQGTITLRVARGLLPLPAGERVGVRGSHITFSVTDTGIGMTEEQLGKLFQAFMQADSSTTRKYGGTGLGLAITKHFAQMMGGDVAVESEYGQGSTFTITVLADLRMKSPSPQPSPQRGEGGGPPEGFTPSPPAMAETPPPRAGEGAGGRGPSSAGRRGSLVLVIDDDPVARGLMQRTLGDAGFEIALAASGDEGLRLARELHPAAITLDVLMPGRDGWSVLAALKADLETADIPVIMATMLDDRNLGYALGATEFLTKPIDRQRLLSLLERYRHPEARTVLVVDDDPAARQAVRRILERDGWAVTEAVDGKDALAAVEAERPALILLDLMMPGLDGFQVVAELQRNEAWREIPVVVVTALDLTPEDRARLNGFVEDVLQKGIYTREALLQEVRTLVEERARAHRAE